MCGYIYNEKLEKSYNTLAKHQDRNCLNEAHEDVYKLAILHYQGEIRAI